MTPEPAITGTQIFALICFFAVVVVGILWSVAEWRDERKLRISEAQAHKIASEFLRAYREGDAARKDLVDIIMHPEKYIT